MDTKKQLETIKEHLLGIVSGDINPHREYGLCDHLYGILDTDIDCDVFINWPENSGCRVFPISVSDVMEPAEEYCGSDDKWDTSTEYGQARIHLCDWLAVQIAVGNVLLEIDLSDDDQMYNLIWNPSK